MPENLKNQGELHQTQWRKNPKNSNNIHEGMFVVLRSIFQSVHFSNDYTRSFFKTKKHLLKQWEKNSKHVASRTVFRMLPMLFKTRYIKIAPKTVRHFGKSGERPQCRTEALPGVRCQPRTQSPANRHRCRNF